jgi:regulator of sirC expression with transglutaminase-like and TPR domain
MEIDERGDPLKAITALATVVFLATGCGRHALVTIPETCSLPVGILEGALAVEPEGLEPERIEELVDGLAGEVSRIRPPEGSSSADLSALNARFFGPEGFRAIHDLSGPESVSVASVVEKRQGTCMGLAVVYLAMAEELRLDAHAVSTPDHLFIRVDLGDDVLNVELLEKGRHIDDDLYRRRHKIDPASIEAGVFMRDLTPGEVIAHLLSNQAVVLSKEGKLVEALARYDAALERAPQLVAAYYNRGLQLMRTGRLEEALRDFDRAIQLHPGDAEAFNNRGLTKVKLDDLEGARADFERALELEPGMREARENLSSLARLGRRSPE